MAKTDDQLKILISQPNFGFLGDSSVHLPYLYAALKSYANRDEEIRDRVLWYEPLFLFENLANIEDRLRRNPVDILGLSCYVWNWNFQMQVGELVKRLYPDCMIIVGGPQPDWNDKKFFNKYPFVDAIVRQEGENPFKEIIKAKINNCLDFQKIPGIFYQKNGEWQDSGKPELIHDFDYNPFVECSDLFKKIIGQYEEVTAIWETNRGCPYSCSFCDWGSATMQKTRLLPMERLENEMEWMSLNKVHTVMINDANFGMFSRDVEIAKRFVELKKRNGYPKKIEFDSAKMSLENNQKIAEILWSAQMISKVKIPWQHMSPVVLSAIKRKEPSVEKKARVAQSLQEKGLRCRPELIMGMPGDNLERYKSSVYQILEFNFSDTLRTNFMLILPNAPAAQEAYRKKWGIETVLKSPAPLHRQYENQFNEDIFYSDVEVVVGCSSYSKKDWVEMASFDSLIKAFHSIGGLTKYLAYYFRFSHGVEFSAFYDELIDKLRLLPEESHFQKSFSILNKRRKNYLMSRQGDYIQPTPEVGFLIGSTEEFYLNLVTEKEMFYKDLMQIILSSFGYLQCEEHIRSLFDFQKNSLITVDYDWRQGQWLARDWNWREYFTKTFAHNGPIKPIFMPEPLNQGHFLKATDSHSSYLLKVPYDWSETDDKDQQYSQWIKVTLDQWNHWSVEGTRLFRQIHIMS